MVWKEAYLYMELNIVMCIIIYLYIILFSIILVIFMTEKEVIERIGKNWKERKRMKKERKRQKGNGRKNDIKKSILHIE